MKKIMKILGFLAIIFVCCIFSFSEATAAGDGGEDMAWIFTKNDDGLPTNAMQTQVEAKMAENKDSEKCAPYNKYKPVENCFLCPIFSTMFNTVNEITAKAITSYSSSVAKVVVVAFGIWLALQILQFVASIETKDLKDLMQAIITQVFLVMLVVIILETGVSNFFNTFLYISFTSLSLYFEKRCT